MSSIRDSITRYKSLIYKTFISDIVDINLTVYLFVEREATPYTVQTRNSEMVEISGN